MGLIFRAVFFIGKKHLEATTYDIYSRSTGSEIRQLLVHQRGKEKGRGERNLPTPGCGKVMYLAAFKRYKRRH